MADTKREDWEIERDREEIATMLSRNRRMSRQRIADNLNRRRREEFSRLMADTMERLGPNSPIPNLREPYELSRQMIDYDVRALEKEFRKRAGEKFETAKGYHLAELEELLRTSWVDYERSKRPTEKKGSQTKAIDLRTTEFFDAGDADLVRRIIVPATQTTDKTESITTHGDPRLLALVRDALQQKSDLQGLNPANEMNLNLQGTDLKLVAGFNPAEWDKEKQTDESSTPALATPAESDTVPK